MDSETSLVDKNKTEIAQILNKNQCVVTEKYWRK